MPHRAHRLRSWARKLSLTGLPPRLLLIVLALGIQVAAHILKWIGEETGYSFFVFPSIACWLVWFVIIFLIAKPSVDSLLRPHIKWLRLAAGVIAVSLIMAGAGELISLHLLNTGTVEANESIQTLNSSLRYNDGTALTHQATEQLLDGVNPYTHANIVQASQDFDLPAEGTTPLKQGAFAEVYPYPTDAQLNEVWSQARAQPDVAPPEFESKVSYPAGSFLFHTPFLALGFKDLRFFYLFCALLTFAIIFWRAPAQLRPIVAIVAVINLELWNGIGAGAIDSLYIMFLFLGWTLRRRLWLSALFMGLAAATKQVAWFFIPFYVILVFREKGWRPCAQSLAIMVSIFTATNMPFIFNAPQAWLESVFAPIRDPMFPRGVGLVALSVADIVPYSSPQFYIVLMAVALIAALAWYYARCLKYPQAGLLLAVMPFFFAWRSHSAYFYLASLLVFGAVIIEEYRHKKLDAVGQDRPATNEE